MSLFTFYVFELIGAARGRKIDELDEPNRNAAWVRARGKHGPRIHVQSRADYEQEKREKYGEEMED